MKNNMNINKGITGIKDQDREILLNMKDDNDLLKACSLNKYINKEVCNDMFFRNRLARTYSNTLKYKSEDESWKSYFLRIIYYIAKMKEKYKYNYEEGNPKVQYEIFKESEYNPDELLIISFEKGELTLVKEALNNRGANISKHDYHGLRMACSNGHLEVVKYVVETFPERVNLSSSRDYPLICAASNGHLEIVKYLVEHGANISAENDDALKWASFGGYLEIVKYLVENGANVSAENDKALKWARSTGNLEVVKYLEANK